MPSHVHKWNEKGEGMLQMIILAAILIGGGYFALQYFGFLGNNTPAPNAPQAATTPTGGSMAGSPAASAVQQSQALGELQGSGR
jgi:hypothetical protein